MKALDFIKITKDIATKNIVKDIYKGTGSAWELIKSHTLDK